MNLNEAQSCSLSTYTDDECLAEGADLASLPYNELVYLERPGKNSFKVHYLRVQSP